MDNKYGYLFTAEDMLAFAKIVSQSGVSVDAEEALDELLDNYSGRFPKDEPLFLVRGKDKQGLPCVRNYRTMTSYTRELDPDPGLLAGLNAVVTQFDEFRLNHPERMKDAD
jgi:hypothetical protein